MCSFRLGVHVFSGAFWHLECLHCRLVSSSACFLSRHFFTRCYVSLLFHEFYIIIPAEFSSRVFPSYFKRTLSNNLIFFCLVFLSCTHTWTDPPTGFISRLPEWKLQHKVITVIHRGLALTLSHRAPGIINSPWIVRGICMAIFTRHNYCQSGDCNQGERECWRVFPQR